MIRPFFLIDAFASAAFTGNPAAVLVLDRFADDAVLTRIAAEHNQAETAFLVADAADYHIRWFTPTVEVPLCGHATLASAHAVLSALAPERDEVVFHSRSGPLTVRRASGGAESSYVMDFPARVVAPAAPSELPAVVAALGQTPTALFRGGENYVAVFNDAAVVRALSPDLAAVARLDCGGVSVTAPGDGGYDFVSRYFTPQHGIDEDHVTGAAHCALAPYWSDVLGRAELRAFQVSARGGEVACTVRDGRVELGGHCVTWISGQAHV